MWYFTWVLGLGFAVLFGILNGIWHEFHLPIEDDAEAPANAGLASGRSNPTGDVSGPM